MGLMTGQHPHIPYPSSSSMPVDTLVAQPAGSPAVYPLGYDGRLLGSTSSYPPRLSVADLYGAAAAAAYPDPAAATAGYMGLAPGHPAAMLYPAALTSGYDLKDPRTAWAALPQAAGYHCDPALAAYGAYGDRYDPMDSEARRRNATRETTSTLKAWLNEHRKNPYPTKGEKIMLAIITKMTLTQVSTWFANARRRLKKENKMTWEPRNKTADDLDDVSIDEDESKKDDDDDEREFKTDDEKDSGTEDRSRKTSDGVSDSLVSSDSNQSQRDMKDKSDDGSSNSKQTSPTKTDIPTGKGAKDSESPSTEKPKIWSLAQTATSTSPPPIRRNIPVPAFGSHDEFESHLRMNRLLLHDRLIPKELSSGFHHLRSELPTDLRTRLGQDLCDPSLSSPPLWRTSESLLSSEKFGRLTPYEGSDLRSISSSSSSSSPAIVSSSLEAGTNITSSLTYSPTRYLGCRLGPPQDGVRTNTTAQDISSRPLPLFSSERYPPGIVGHSLDMRSVSSPYSRTSPFACPVTFGLSQPTQTATDPRR